MFCLSDVNNYDFLWISDIDEIPNKNSIFKIGRLSMYFSYYKMNLLKREKWVRAKAILGKNIHFQIKKYQIIIMIGMKLISPSE